MPLLPSPGADPDPAGPARRPASRGFGCAAAFVAALLVLALLAGFIFYRVERAVRDTASQTQDYASQVRDALVAITGLQGHVTVNEEVVIEQAKPVFELATLERDTVLERETENHWLGSTKHLRLRGVYHIKAGYDLKNDFKVSVLGNGGEVIRLSLPPPRILSVELRRIDILTMDNGMWNHFSKDEMDTEVNTLTLDARLKAANSDTAEEAQRMLVEQLQQKLGPGHRVEVATPTPSPRSGTPRP